MRFVIITDEENDQFALQSLEAIKRILGPDSRVIPFSMKNLITLRDDEIVFNLAVGKRHDFIQALIAAVLENMKIPFVGSPAYTHYVCLDKFTTKAVLSSYGIRTPRGAIYGGKEIHSNLPDAPFIVKPVAEGSGIGIDKSSFCNDVQSALHVAKEKYEEFGENILIEEYLNGTEVTVAVIGNGDEAKVLPPLEIDFSHLPDGVERYYSKRVKEEYADKTVYNCPPVHLDQETLKMVEETALLVFKSLKARDFIRMDMRVVDGVPYVIEVNSRPGLHPVMSDIPKMVKAISKDYEWLIKSICERVIKEAGGKAWKRKD